MSQFILKIELGNDTMQDYRDISRALKEVSEKLKNSDLTRVQYLKMEPVKIRDINGNTVGFYQVVPDKTGGKIIVGS
jgi:hypothetical protein